MHVLYLELQNKIGTQNLLKMWYFWEKKSDLGSCWAWEIESHMVWMWKRKVVYGFVLKGFQESNMGSSVRPYVMWETQKQCMMERSEDQLKTEDILKESFFFYFYAREAGQDLHKTLKSNK